MKFIREFNKYNNDILINDIKKSLIMENLVDEEEFQEKYDSNWYIAWIEFVDNQENGDCQGIVSSIVNDFPIVKKCFGEIEVDEPYIDEWGDEQKLMTHHWIQINDEIYDFSKGTLRDYITWSDIYNVEVEDEWRYNKIG
jgi:hypothetical protein